MNQKNFTQKSQEAIQAAQMLSREYGNPQIEQAHLLYALLKQENGLIPQLLGNLGLTVPSFEAAVRAEVEKLPKVSGGGREADKVYVAQDVDRALNAAEETAKSMKDEYISVEHLFLGLLDAANSALKELFRTYNVSREKVMQALANVRGNQRVTSDNPEETYDALKRLEQGFTPSDELTAAREAQKSMEALQPKEYQSSFEGELAQLYDQITGRKAFSYDPQTDAQAKNYAYLYTQKGREAMADTMGQAASLTGGYGSSYAQAVGQQAYDRYLGELAALVPELRQAALAEYRQEGQALTDRYNMLNQQEKAGYDRWQDRVAQWQKALSEAQSSYEDVSAQDEKAYQAMLKHYADKAGQERKLRAAQEKTAEFIRRSDELCKAQSAFLQSLPEQDFLPEKKTQSAAQEDVVSAIEQDILSHYADVEPAQEEVAVTDEPTIKLPPVDGSAIPSDFRLSLDELKFGRNYNGDAK